MFSLVCMEFLISKIRQHLLSSMSHPTYYIVTDYMMMGFLRRCFLTRTMIVVMTAMIVSVTSAINQAGQTMRVFSVTEVVSWYLTD